jgi:uncharacterized protein YqgV (UPF0045/DUF77 family)
MPGGEPRRAEADERTLEARGRRGAGLVARTSLPWQAPRASTRTRPSPRGSTVIVAFSISPLGADHHVGDAVAECVRIVRESGLPNETNAMFTNLEGDWDQIQAVIKSCIEACERHAPRVSLVLKLDHHPGAGHEHSLAYKTRRVEEALADDTTDGD